jgi:hypothetical protein
MTGFSPFASSTLDDPQISTIAQGWTIKEEDASKAAMAATVPAMTHALAVTASAVTHATTSAPAVTCRAALDVLATCPIVPSNWHNTMSLSRMLEKDVLIVCCAASKSFNDLGCGKRPAHASKLLDIMGGISCSQATNGKEQTN